MKRTVRDILGPSLYVCLAFGSVLFAQDSTKTGHQGPKDKLHIYLLIGQSNIDSLPSCCQSSFMNWKLSDCAGYYGKANSYQLESLR